MKFLLLKLRRIIIHLFINLSIHTANVVILHFEVMSERNLYQLDLDFNPTVLGALKVNQHRKGN